MTKVKRTHDLADRLKKGEHLSFADVATIYEIGDRSARRYIAQMPDILGVQLERNEENKKYFLPDKSGFSLLSDEEEIIVNMIIEHSKSMGKDTYEKTMKLLSKFKDSIHQNVFYSKVDMESVQGYEQNLLVVEKAITHRNIIKCIYKGKERTVKPLKIACFEGYWYLVFKDCSSGEIRKFYFKDISDIKTTEEKFDDVSEDLQNKLDCAINAYFQGDGKCFPVMLSVEKDVAAYFTRKPVSKTQRIVNKYENGSLDIEVMVSHDMEIVPIIQRYMPYVKVIEPARIWDAVLKNASLLE